MSKISTPWKKSRTYGDIHGGRKRRKFSDNIFKRGHSIIRPNPNDELPILIEENPSRDFFFPISGDELIQALHALPKEDHEDLTHIWLRRVKKADHIDKVQPLGCYTSGSGVNMITLFPWPKSMIISYGNEKPENKFINEANGYGAKVCKKGNEWISKWNIESLRKFYIQGILYFLVGHHVNYYNRHFSSANKKQRDEFSAQYAISKTVNAMHIYDSLETD